LPTLRKPAWGLAIALILIGFLSLSLARPGFTWMNAYGPGKVAQSFNRDDDRFLRAARDFGNAGNYLQGYPPFMTTQLFVVGALGGSLGIKGAINPFTLRVISFAWALALLVLMAILARWYGLSPLGAALSAFFLAVAPQFVLLANQGTADISALVLFYGSVLAAMLARTRRSRWWFYASWVLAGVAMADKFFLPALVAPALLVLAAPRGRKLEAAFLGGALGVVSFCAAGLFTFTPWDFKRLMTMLMYDNVMIDGGRNPLQQLIAYSGDMFVTAGIITTLLAIAAVVICAFKNRSRVKPIRGAVPNDARGFAAAAVRLATQPTALLVLPLLFNLALILNAQVHFGRHVLVYAPVVCLLAASLVDGIVNRLRQRSTPVRAAALIGGILAALLLFANAYAVSSHYSDDIRIPIANRIARDPDVPVTATNFYTAIRGTRQIDEPIPSSARYLTCDIEFARYLGKTNVRQVFHPYGGRQRLRFLNALFAGRTQYRPILTTEREPRSLEEYAAAQGLLPELDTKFPDRCILFDRTGIAPRMS